MGAFNQFVNDPLLHSKWLNPDYLFSLIYKVLHFVVPYVFRGENISIFRLILAILALFFIIVIAYSAVRILEVRAREHEHLHHEIIEYAHHQAEKQKAHEEANGGFRNERWEAVLRHLFSMNLSDWKLAIIEADLMLESLLDQLGFKGDTLGDKLKSADQDTFHNLSIAWEAHTIRNRIAHEGLNFEISAPEAKRVISLYEQIFRQYGYI